MSTITKATPIGYLSTYLNDGKVKGHKVGDKLEFTNSRGTNLHGEVAEVIGRAGRCTVVSLHPDRWGVVYDVHPKRPMSVADLKARARVRRPAKRDERGRFTR
jgi:hypothetical protein